MFHALVSWNRVRASGWNHSHTPSFPFLIPLIQYLVSVWVPKIMSSRFASMKTPSARSVLSKILFSFTQSFANSYGSSNSSVPSSKVQRIYLSAALGPSKLNKVWKTQRRQKSCNSAFFKRSRIRSFELRGSQELCSRRSL